MDNKDDDVGSKMEERYASPERSTAQSPVDEDTRFPRSKEGTHPTRISDMRDAVTPTGSTRNGSKSTVRKAQFPGGNRKNQEAKAVSRKAKETVT